MSLHSDNCSWRKTGKRFGLNAAMARLIANGYIPGKHIRLMLGLPLVASVVVVEGDVPDGAQVLRADLCECGQWYIKNHPRRRKCFICSPYRKARK